MIVKQQTGTPVVIPYNPLLPIMWIKMKIGIEGHTFELYLEEPGQDNVALLNDKRLADYGIFYDTTIRLHLKSMKKNTIIFVLLSLFFLLLFTFIVLGLSSLDNIVNSDIKFLL